MLTRWFMALRFAAVAAAIALMIFHPYLFPTRDAAIRACLIVTVVVSCSLGLLPTLVGKVVAGEMRTAIRETLRDELRLFVSEERVRLLDDELARPTATGTEGNGSKPGSKPGRSTVAYIRDK